MFSLFSKNKVKSIAVNDLDGKLNNIKLIDIRESYEVKSSTIKGAKNIPMNMLINNPEKYLHKDEEYYIICQSGMRSSGTVKHLDKLGYNVVNVLGGISQYRGKNLKR